MKVSGYKGSKKGHRLKEEVHMRSLVVGVDIHAKPHVENNKPSV